MKIKTRFCLIWVIIALVIFPIFVSGATRGMSQVNYNQSQIIKDTRYKPNVIPNNKTEYLREGLNFENLTNSEKFMETDPGYLAYTELGGLTNTSDPGIMVDESVLVENQTLAYINDNNSSANYLYYENFGAKTSGSISFWYEMLDNGASYITVIGDNGLAFQLRFYFGNIYYYLGGGYVKIRDLSLNHLYYITVKFSCSSDEFSVYADYFRLSLSNIAFENVQSNINYFEISSTDFDNPEIYFGKLIYSWDSFAYTGSLGFEGYVDNVAGVNVERTDFEGKAKVFDINLVDSGVPVSKIIQKDNHAETYFHDLQWMNLELNGDTQSRLVYQNIAGLNIHVFRLRETNYELEYYDGSGWVSLGTNVWHDGWFLWGIRVLPNNKTEISIDGSVVFNAFLNRSTLEPIYQKTMQQEDSNAHWYIKPLSSSLYVNNRALGSNDLLYSENLEYRPALSEGPGGFTHLHTLDNQDLGNLTAMNKTDYDGGIGPFNHSALQYQMLFPMMNDYFVLNNAGDANYDFNTTCIMSLNNSEFLWNWRNETRTYFSVKISDKIQITAYNSTISNYTLTYDLYGNDSYPYYVKMGLRSSDNALIVKIMNLYQGNSTQFVLDALNATFPIDGYGQIGFASRNNSVAYGYLFGFDSNYINWLWSGLDYAYNNDGDNIEDYLPNLDANFTDNRILTIYNKFDKTFENTNFLNKTDISRVYQNFNATIQRVCSYANGSIWGKYQRVNAIRLNASQSANATFNYLPELDSSNFYVSTLVNTKNIESGHYATIILKLGYTEIYFKMVGRNGYSLNVFNDSVSVYSVSVLGGVGYFPQTFANMKHLVVSANASSIITIHFGMFGNWEFKQIDNLNYSVDNVELQIINYDYELGTSYNSIGMPIYLTDFSAGKFTEWADTTNMNYSTPKFDYQNQYLYSGTDSAILSFNKPVIPGYEVWWFQITTLKYSILDYPVQDYWLWNKTYYGTNKTIVEFAQNATDQYIMPEYVFDYDQHDNFKLYLDLHYSIFDFGNITHTSKLFTEVWWEYYYKAPNASILTTIASMFAPLLIYFVFPYVFYTRWGKKGATIGLVFGGILMGITSLIPWVYSLLLSGISLVIVFVVFKRNGGDLTDE